LKAVTPTNVQQNTALSLLQHTNAS
jgi:hypothetical protein